MFAHLLLKRSHRVALAVAAVAIGALVLNACKKSGESTGEDKDAAIDAAKTWLALVDAGDHGRAWDEAASYFKSAVKREDWITAATAARKPLGKLISRSLKSATPETSLPGAPDGRYVVIQFSTKLENKESAIETITPMLDKDGKWRVSGYYIK